MNPILINSPKKQNGLSLVELMVALLISSILLLGVLELFGSSSKSSRSANALARMQENGRLALDLIAREARRTGFNGCDGGIAGDDKMDFGLAGEVDFPSESIKPIDAIGVKDKRLTFRYLGTSDGVNNNDCKRENLKDKKYFVSFFNCDKNLCVSSTNTNQQVLLNHAEIIDIQYIQPCSTDPDEDKTCSHKEDNIPEKNGKKSFADVKKIQVTLKICTDTLSESSPNYCKEGEEGSKTAIRRTFSSLIELRNRLL